MAFSRQGAAQLLADAPTALFPIALGLAGLAGALRVAGRVHDAALPAQAGLALLLVAAVTLACVVLLYSAKLLRTRQAVVADLAVASRANLIAPGFMAGMLIGGGLSNMFAYGPALWLVATLGHLVLLVHFVGQWLTRDYASDELGPTWFLPAAGIITAALSWPGIGPRGLPLFALAVGTTLWLMLLPLVFRRLVFEPAIAAPLRPSLFIVAAPFALLANGLLNLYPGLPAALPLSLALAGLFFIAVLVSRPRFLAAAGVSLSWWAATFPVSAVATAFLALSPVVGDSALILGTAMLALACVTTAIAIVATVRSAWRTCRKTVGRTRTEVAAMQGTPGTPPPSGDG